MGLPCELESMTWTPWGGVVVSDFVIRPTEGSGFGGEILRVKTIELDPSWISLAQKKKRFERLEFSGVTGDVSIEFLKTLIGSSAPPVVQNTAPQPKTLDQSPPPDENPSEDPAGTEGRETQTGKKESPVAHVQPVEDFEGTIVFKDVNLVLRSIRFPDYSVAVEAMEGEFPVWGREREGKLIFAALYLGGEMVNGPEELPVRWRDGFLGIDDHSIKIAGLDVELVVAMRMARGLPLGIQFNAPRQQVDFSPLFGEGKSPVSIGKFAMKGRLQGYLTMPQSFVGFGNVGFQDLSIRDGKDGTMIDFYQGYGEAKINRGGLIIPNARMVGDEEAILFNGFATSNGEAAATVRLVGSPERADTYEKRVRRAHETWSLGFGPLVTEDRLFRDLRVEMSEDGLTVDLAEGKKPVALFSAMQAILKGQPYSPILLQ